MISVAYIGLGSNLGDSAGNLRAAVDMMREIAVDIRRSPMYRTAPQGFSNQPPFYNAVCRVAMVLTPYELMERLLRIESELGRRRTFRNAPRLLDLDILLFGRRVLNTPPVILPHPGMAERLFVLKPLADIAPQLRHPVNGLTVAEMLRSLPAQSDAIERVEWR